MIVDIYGELYLYISQLTKIVKDWSSALNEPDEFWTLHKFDMLQVTKCYTFSNICLA